MQTKEVATLSFIDSENRDEAVVIVRVTEGSVGLCLSLKKDGDMEVFMPTEDCRKLIQALQSALA